MVVRDPDRFDQGGNGAGGPGPQSADRVRRHEPDVLVSVFQECDQPVESGHRRLAHAGKRERREAPDHRILVGESRTEPGHRADGLFAASGEPRRCRLADEGIGVRQRR